MNGHHLILGEITDFLSGKRIASTHDEAYRQKLARFLVQDLGYPKKELASRIEVSVRAGDKTAVAVLDFAVTLGNRYAMAIKYGPGSLVTRHRLSLALSRLLSNCQVPVVVVSNGETADVLNGHTGKLIGTGFDAIPPHADLPKIVEIIGFHPVSGKQREMESRIVYAFEIDDACPCDLENGTCPPFLNRSGNE
jgi:hypothetical protein